VARGPPARPDDVGRIRERRSAIARVNPLHAELMPQPIASEDPVHARANDPRPESAWRLGGLSIAELGTRLWTDINGILDRSAALSYYFIFALFPTLLFLTALIALLPMPHLSDRLMAYVGDVLPGEAGVLVKRTLGEALHGAHPGLLSLGAVSALWAASSGMTSIMAALNVEPRPWWRERLLAVGLTVVFSVLAVIALVLLVFGARLGEVIADRTGWGSIFRIIWQIVRWPAAIVLGITAISLVYRLAPAANQRWAWVTPGSALAVGAWAIMSVALRFYVGHFANYNATYGSIGGIILLMLWLYLSGVALLAGAAINSEIARAALARRGEPGTGWTSGERIPTSRPKAKLKR
jgi:membrane protein